MTPEGRLFCTTRGRGEAGNTCVLRVRGIVTSSGLPELLQAYPCPPEYIDSAITMVDNLVRGIRNGIAIVLKSGEVIDYNTMVSRLSQDQKALLDAKGVLFVSAQNMGITDVAEGKEKVCLFSPELPSKLQSRLTTGRGGMLTYTPEAEAAIGQLANPTRRISDTLECEKLEEALERTLKFSNGPVAVSSYPQLELESIARIALYELSRKPNQ